MDVFVRRDPAEAGSELPTAGYPFEMATSAEAELLALLNEQEGGQSPRRYEAVVRLIAQLAGGHQSVGVARGPDVVVSREDRTPVSIEIKISHVGSLSKNTNNRVSDLLAAALEQNRAFRGAITQSALFLVVGQQGTPPEKFADSLASRLLRAPDGVGYDSVLVGWGGDELRWQFFAADQHRSSGPVIPMSTREAFRLVREQDAPSSVKPTPPSTRRLRILLVADEWRSGRGGISTVNRELASALAAAEVDAAVFVPRASEQDARSAAECGVALVTPALVPGLSEREAMLLKPIFSTRGWTPDVIIGHGRVLGPFAAAQQQQYFATARRVHFVHTDAEQLEAAKESSGGASHMLLADERRAVERSLASSADLVVGLGPLLTETIRDELLGTGTSTKVICLVPGLRDTFDLASTEAPVKNRILIVGRADDFISKGIDIAAETLLRVVDHWPHNRPHVPELVIRGVPEQFADEVKAKLDLLFDGRVSYVLRPYTDSEDDLLNDVAQARVLLMPSRHEGFGLAAYEAIAAGLPVRISAQSGLAQFLHEHHIDSSPTSIVTTRNIGSDLALDRWVEAVREVLEDPIGARLAAVELRASIADVVDWQSSARALLDEIRALGT